MSLTIHSWNVNGLRSILKKSFGTYLESYQPDILCLQETKLTKKALGERTFPFPYPHQYYHCAGRKGYAGTAILTRYEPLRVTYDLPRAKHPKEGRVITLEYKTFFLVNTYTPNAQADLVRLPYRNQQWDPDFRCYLKKLKKPVIACGDFNVAHQEIDLSRPQANRRNAGFTDEERSRFSELLAIGLIDAYRYCYPDKTDAYTWWSYRSGARARNIGWRIDYCLVSSCLLPQLEKADIFAAIRGSDHCPIGVTLSDTGLGCVSGVSYQRVFLLPLITDS